MPRRPRPRRAPPIAGAPAHWPGFARRRRARRRRARRRPRAAGRRRIARYRRSAGRARPRGRSPQRWRGSRPRPAPRPGAAGRWRTPRRRCPGCCRWPRRRRPQPSAPASCPTAPRGAGQPRAQPRRRVPPSPPEPRLRLPPEGRRRGGPSCRRPLVAGRNQGPAPMSVGARQRRAMGLPSMTLDPLRGLRQGLRSCRVRVGCDVRPAAQPGLESARPDADHA